MGGKSSSSQKQETNTQNLHLEDLDGVTVAGSENVRISVSDQGAIAAGREIALASLDGMQESATELFGFLESRERQAIDTIADQSADSLAEVAELTRQAVAVTNQSDSQQALDSAIKLGGVAVIVLGAAYALKR